MQAILLDLDDTLIDEKNASRQAFLSFIAENSSRFAAQDQQDLFNQWRTLSQKYWLQFEQGEISFQNMRRQRLRAFLAEPLADSAADAIISAYLKVYQASWQVLPEVADFLVLSKDIPKAIISNGDREQQLQKITAMGLDAHIQIVITPIDCGCFKPAYGIFKYALAQLGVAAEQTLMIGDCMIRDIQPAHALGMHTFHVEPYSTSKNLVAALESYGLVNC
ncbi:HAD family hydrolase [Iodobacter sp.]|uniref:HAD family hydrolase n=1 Tax=Iodobacter sp. TaxID=1915058 RepID=UPI0025E0F72B|nr:HAD family hydrolase [Iodobacter sp.]